MDMWLFNRLPKDRCLQKQGLALGSRCVTGVVSWIAPAATLSDVLWLQEVDNMSASEARRRLEAFRKKQQAAAAAKQQQQGGGPPDAAAGGASDLQAAAAAAAANVSFEGAISEAFEESLKYYVAEEQKEVRHRPSSCFTML